MMATAANANDAFERLVEQITREVLELDNSGSTEEGGYGSFREAVEETWKGYPGPGPLAADLDQAVRVIEGFCVASEDIGPVLLALLSDCKGRTVVARELARRALKARDERSPKR